jgi:hypothetical protein
VVRVRAIDNRPDEAASLVIEVDRSRSTVSLKKVTIRSLPSSRVSTTKPGTRRSWTAPQSRSTAQTSSGGASTMTSLRTEAIGQ